MKENPRLQTLAVRSTTYWDSPGPADARFNLVGLQEGDPAATPVTGDNPQVVRWVTALGHRHAFARWWCAHPRVSVTHRWAVAQWRRSSDGLATGHLVHSFTHSGGERAREKREWLRVLQVSASRWFFVRPKVARDRRSWMDGTQHFGLVLA
jgi:hypothetical protein